MLTFDLVHNASLFHPFPRISLSHFYTACLTFREKMCSEHCFVRDGLVLAGPLTPYANPKTVRVN